MHFQTFPVGKGKEALEIHRVQRNPDVFNKRKTTCYYRSLEIDFTFYPCIFMRRSSELLTSRLNLMGRKSLVFPHAMEPCELFFNYTKIFRSIDKASITNNW
jgi:hypothetical protein